MFNILKVLCFLGFIGFGLAIVWAERFGKPTPRRTVLVNTFLLYCLLVSFGAGLTQREAWPFSTWPLVAGIHPASATHSRLVTVDVSGIEHNIDYRAWQPLVSDELLAWFDAKLLLLDTSAQELVCNYLLDLVETSRMNARLGKGVGYFNRYFGPLTAPYFLLHPALWAAPDRVPAAPFVGLRLYRETWNLEQRQQDPGRVTRNLVYDYRRP